MSTPALKVVSTELAEPLGRHNLVAALAHREATMAQYVAASASVTRLRGLIDAETSALAACAALERQSADGAASWARDPTKELDIPTEETVAEARRNLAQASRLADAARAALPAMIAAANSASVPHTQAVRLVVEAIHGELCAEAEKIRAEQLALEQRTRELCERLIAIGAVLRANPAPGAGSGEAESFYWSRIRGWTSPDRESGAFAHTTVVNPDPNLARLYSDFASRLVRDPAATLA